MTSVRADVFAFLTRTTMSGPRLPPELLDLIVDLLHRRESVLRHCCLVSKSWIPRTRRHLFANIRFDTVKKLQSWKGRFPDPSASPARYTKALFVDCPHAVTAADTGEGGWIRAFSKVAQLEVGCLHGGPAISLIPFHGFSPVMKILHLNFTLPSPSEIFNLILSFPLLEDLTVVSYGTELTDNGDGSDELSATAQLSNPPAFTGSLTLLRGGLKYLALWLLSLSSGIHFRELDLTCVPKEDLLLAAALVGECSHSLESLDIACDGVLGASVRPPRPRDDSFPFPVKSRSASVDLSRAMRLKELSFRVNSWCVDWIATALRTVAPKHLDLRQISIHVYFDSANSVGANVRQIIGEQLFEQWLGLDRLLVQLWESHSIRPKIQYYVLMRKEKDVSDCVGCLLPGTTEGRIIDLVDGYSKRRTQGA